jgi:hypothetical protein
MSVYAQAVMSTADMLTGASVDAAYNAAYGTAYKAYQGMQNAANQKVAAEANIAAIRQDKINTNKTIQAQQINAEAQAKVLAAVTGTEGGSLDATIHQTKVNSSLAVSNTAQKMDQMIEDQLASVYSAQSTMLAIDSPQVQDIDPLTAAMSSLTGSITSGEVEDLMEQIGFGE